MGFLVTVLGLGPDGVLTRPTAAPGPTIHPWEGEVVGCIPCPDGATTNVGGEVDATPDLEYKILPGGVILCLDCVAPFVGNITFVGVNVLHDGETPALA